LGVAAAPRLHVWNKIDLLAPNDLKRLPSGPHDVAVSARTGEGLEQLLRMIDDHLVDDPLVEAEFEFSPADGERLASLHRIATVLSRRYEDDRVVVRARLRESQRRRLQIVFSNEANARS
jgi:GTP-binding protein HflX